MKLSLGTLLVIAALYFLVVRKERKPVDLAMDPIVIEGNPASTASEED